MWQGSSRLYSAPWRYNLILLGLRLTSPISNGRLAVGEILIAMPRGSFPGAAWRPRRSSFRHVNVAGYPGRSLVGGTTMERGDCTWDLSTQPFASDGRTPDPPRLCVAR